MKELIDKLGDSFSDLEKMGAWTKEGRISHEKGYEWRVCLFQWGEETHFEYGSSPEEALQKAIAWKNEH